MSKTNSDYRKRVVITGLGCTTGLGETLDKTWAAVLAGDTNTTSLFPPHVRLPYPLPGVPCPAISAQPGSSPALQLLNKAVEAAWHDANASEIDYRKMGVYTSTVFGDGNTFDMAQDLVYRFSIDGPAHHLQSLRVCGAETIAFAAKAIAASELSAVVVAGVEAPFHHLTEDNFPLGALSPTPLPCQSWATGRDGLVLGEGAAALVMENMDHAVERGAHIYAEITGVGLMDNSVTLQGGFGLQHALVCAMHRALAHAGLSYTDVDAVLGHGEATIKGDAVEAAAYHTGLGRHAVTIPVMSTKPYHGHLLGASALMEIALLCKMLAEQVIPPSITNHSNISGDGLYHGEPQSTPHAMQQILKVNWGLAGDCSALVIGRPDLD